MPRIRLRSVCASQAGSAPQQSTAEGSPWMHVPGRVAYIVVNGPDLLLRKLPFVGALSRLVKYVGPWSVASPPSISAPMANFVRASSLGALPFTQCADGRDDSDAVPTRAIRPHRDLLVVVRPTLSLPQFFRIDGVARFMQPTAAMYTLSAVPADAEWGAGEEARRLCVGPDRSPVDIWTVGTVERLFFFTAFAGVTSVSVTIRLLRQGDRDRMVRLLRRSSPKTKAADIPSQVMTVSLNLPPGATVFRRFYDASQRYQQTSIMDKIGVNELVGGDIVLVQSSFIRSFDALDPDAWQVSFQLSSISLLYAVPRATLPDVDNGFRGQL
ncbi:hypothetical protein OH76DRAFT_1477969 [Lentinus brumalis]|uniref:Uncharacterized protein n=1 Tax=Lentinus brumalis TaxID=2498619 RepID=A0A371DRZ2_9APHY|nr:hypothetical protein OH76DRAFT_1477969 [Polyporus brumalis]